MSDHDWNPSTGRFSSGTNDQVVAKQPLVVPVIHMGGTRRDNLVEQLQDNCYAIEQARRVMASNAPHGRDYPKPGTLELALEQHAKRLLALEDVYHEYQAILEGVVSQ